MMETAVQTTSLTSTVMLLPSGGLRVSTRGAAGDQHRQYDQLRIRLACDDRARCFKMDMLSDQPCAGKFMFITEDGSDAALRLEDEASFVSLVTSLERIEALCNLPLSDRRRDLALQWVSGPGAQCVPVVVDLENT